jgi:hypothetical protein
MKIYYITAREAFLNVYNCFTYYWKGNFGEMDRLKHIEIKKLQQSGAHIIDSNNAGLISLNKISSKYLGLIKSTEMEEYPFRINNTSRTAQYINESIGKHLKEAGFKKLNPLSSYILHSKTYDILQFTLTAHCEAEVFPSGRVYLYFYLSSAIELIGTELATRLKEFNRIASDNGSEWKDIIITVRNLNKHTTFSLILGADDFDIQLEKIKDFANHKITVRQYDMYLLFPDHIDDWMKFSKHNQLSALRYLTKISQQSANFRIFSSDEKPFLRIETKSFQNQKNIRTATGLFVKPTQIFYGGFYKPVTDGIIQIINFTKRDPTILMHLISKHFNQNGQIDFLPVITFDKNNFSAIASEVRKQMQAYTHKLVILFTDSMLPPSYLKLTNKLNSKTEISPQDFDNYSLSNFVVKCLSRMGGIPYVLHDLREDKHCYFLGLDLGHSTKSKRKYTNVGYALFDHVGWLIADQAQKDVPLNEVISNGIYTEIIDWVASQLNSRALPEIKKIIIHRDGKFSAAEKAALLKIIKSKWGEIKIELIDILKQGQPYMGSYELNQYKSLPAGIYWQVPDEDYAFMICNNQESIPNEIQRPITVRRVHGEGSFADILWQVYWLCHLYTNNIYYPTRTPCTINIPHKVARTGKR